MRAPIWIWDGVCVAEELLVVGVRIMQADLNDHFVPRALNHNGLGVDESFVLNQAVDKLLHSSRVENLHGFGALLAFIEKSEGEWRVDVREIVEASNDALGLELDRFLEDFGVRHEGDECPRLLCRLDLGDHMQLLLGCSALERHGVDFPLAGYLHLKPLRDSINTLCSHAMCAAGVFVVALAVFATRVQTGQHEFDARDAFLFVYVHGNTTPVITNGNRAVRMDRHIDMAAVAC